MKLVLAFALASATSVLAAEWDTGLKPFLELHCYDCHGDGAKKGGLAMDELTDKLADPAVFAKWERIYDRALNGEMPPKKIKDRPTVDELQNLRLRLEPVLASAHEKAKGTVLRRLNRREYQNAMNDLFGTDLKLEGMLPEDGRSHEFDVVGEALGVSMTHLQSYIEAAGLVFDAAVAKTTEAPQPNLIEAKFSESTLKQVVGDRWVRAKDGAIVRFSEGGYPSGHLREGRIREPGLYRIRVTGYAYQSVDPLPVYFSAISYAPGSEKPILGFASFPPGKPTTIEKTGWLEPNQMLVVEPYGIRDADSYTRKKTGESIHDYKGPGFAFLSATMEGPIIEEFPSRGHKLIFGNLVRREIEPSNPKDKEKSWYTPKFEIISEDESADAAKAIKRLAAYAFRRAVTDEDLAPYLALFKKEREKESFESSLRTVFTALFSSPHFLYLREMPGRLDDLALANRLSLFLNRTLPERELLSLAFQSKLIKDPAALRKETERLLKHGRFDRFLTDFTESWLDLRDMDFTEPDKKLFPEFDRGLQRFMVEETEAFLRELIDSNLPSTNVVKSEFAMLNERLAEHYGVPGIRGVGIRKVNLPVDSPRGGFLSQGSVLKVTANGTNTSPVMRGVWVMERILGKTPTPPPPNVPGVEPDVRGAESLRDLLVKHRSMESCQGCHAKFDPLGFALESFNPIGGYREHYRSLGNHEHPKVNLMVKGRAVQYRQGPKVDASGTFEGDLKFAGFTEFQSHLARQPETLSRALAKKLLTFATGRELGFSDRTELERIVKESARTGYRVRDLIHLVISSKIFQSK